MKLPNAENALVEDAKLLGYLLNHDHPHGTHKARYLGRFGFSSGNLDAARSALLRHGRSYDVARVVQTGYGPRYAVDGVPETPDQRDPYVRTVWQMDSRVCETGRSGDQLIRRSCAPPDHGISFGRVNIHEHDCVVLTADLPADGLEAGDVGTVVHIHRDGEAYEVEFMTLAGNTLAVATVLAGQCRPVSKRDVSHVRELVAA